MRALSALIVGFLAVASPALAQVNPGTSPLSGSKGGTNNGFMQFSGPASSLKTFTLPNASGTIDLLNAIQTFTAAKTFADATLLLAGSSSGTTMLKASATASGVLTLPAATDTLVARATADVLTNKTVNCANNTCTVRIASDVTGLGTGVATALGINIGSVGAFVANGGALGTPSSGTLTNVTGLPVASGISGFGTGVATALGVNVGSAGAVVVNGGALGTPSSGTLTNATGLPVAGITGFGTGVATALGVNIGSVGAFVANGGALGTPSSGTLTNATGLPVAGITGLGTGVATALGTATGSVNGFPRVVATGTIALGTSAIASGACGTAATATATGVSSSDIIDLGFSSDPTGVTGYTPSAMLTIVPIPSANTVSFKQCNLTGSSITPSALTLNWAVRR